MGELNGHPLDEARPLNGSPTPVTHGLNVAPPPVPADHSAAAALEAERARLESEILGAQARLTAARRHADEANQALHQVVLSSKARLAEMEAEHERYVTMIRDTARAEVERILDDARRQVGAPLPSSASPASPASPASTARTVADDVS